MASGTIQWDAASWQSLDRLLKELPANVVAREVKKANNKAMRQVVKVMRTLAPRRTGLFRKSIGVRTKGYGKTGNVYSIAGTRRGFKDPVTGENPTQIAHLIEYGVAPHTIAPKHGEALAIKARDGSIAIVHGSVNHPGIEKRPFARPAFDQTKHNTMKTMGDALAIGVAKQADKLKWPVRA